jgi:hypothetical protein
MCTVDAFATQGMFYHYSPNTVGRTPRRRVETASNFIINKRGSQLLEKCCICSCIRMNSFWGHAFGSILYFMIAITGNKRYWLWYDTIWTPWPKSLCCQILGPLFNSNSNAKHVPITGPAAQVSLDQHWPNSTWFNQPTSRTIALQDQLNQCTINFVWDLALYL